MGSDEARDVRRMAAAVAISVLGMAYHSIREFGASRLLSPETGTIPVVAVQVFLFVVWWLVHGSRAGVGRALVLIAALQLLGGAFISVLPLRILPFQPEQSASHYLSHLVYGIAQLPLIVIALRQARSRSPKVRDRL